MKHITPQMVRDYMAAEIAHDIGHELPCDVDYDAIHTSDDMVFIDIPAYRMVGVMEIEHGILICDWIKT